ncbi:ATP-NAD kinase family protein [Paraburkholderia diazotrophica]|uniref:Predicted polyphosphate-or ATP-dependent NAD kinase n=1 Tax=Paraburkholderia diazotrophica TaxID=667676 RepID=A0A1H6ZXQ8_9BURK|nr:NAD(+)/NADH kinase [Paraburkholderia diazotrophica]SEJ56407.1 Predicted polyphosphate-or ATP-dependent NAD kinase [Paraburkholderia diazotrophica]
MASPITVGVIANPASGRDIRRLTTHASVFPTAEKANMVVRLLAGLGALGVDRVLTLRDRTGVASLLLRALDTHAATGSAERWPEVEFVDLPITESVADTHAGTAHMVREGVELIAVLGGDGTHRAVAAHSGGVPLLTLSTGTNNAFPDMREATVAGLAGALVASGAVPPDVALTRNKRLVVRCVAGPNRGREEVALVDVCVSRQRFVGARAVSEPSDIESLFLTFASPDGIGLSSIGGAWAPVERTAPHGLHLTFAQPDEHGAMNGDGVPIFAPIAPGRIDQVTMRSCERFEVGDWLPVDACRGTLAFDGEREIEIERDDRYEISLDWSGPLTVDVSRTLRFAASRQLMREMAGASMQAIARAHVHMQSQAQSQAQP